MGTIAYKLGLSSAVGAFLAGNIISSLKNAKEFEKPMHPFVFVFTSLFFFSIGAIVDFNAVGNYLGLVVLLFIVSVVAKFLSIGLTTYLFSNTSGRGAIFAGVSMVSLGEFSLLLAAEANDLVPNFDVVSIVAVVIFLSSVTMSILVIHADSIYQLFLRKVPTVVRTDLDVASVLMKEVSKKVRANRKEEKFTLEWSRILNNFIGLIFIGALVWLWYEATNFQYLAQATDFLSSIAPFWVWAIAVVGALLFPTFAIVRNFRHFLSDFSESLLETYPREIANSKKLYRNILLIVFVFASSVIIPPLVSLMGLRPIWGAVSIPLLIILILLFLNSESLLEKMHEHNHRHPRGFHNHGKRNKK
jgi:Kef-type K+ transport system membrane component KefB